MLLFVAVVFIALSIESYFIMTFPPYFFLFLIVKAPRDMRLLYIGLELPHQLYIKDSGIHASNRKLGSDKNQQSENFSHQGREILISDSVWANAACPAVQSEVMAVPEFGRLEIFWDAFIRRYRVQLRNRLGAPAYDYGKTGWPLVNCWANRPRVGLTSPGAKSIESHLPTHLLRGNLKHSVFHKLIWATDVFVRQKYCTFSKVLFINPLAFLFLKVLVSKKYPLYLL